MSKFFLSFLFFLSATYCFAQDDTTQYIVPNRYNSEEQQKKPYVILISVDGFRYDYAQKFNAVNILKLAKNGVAAKSMTPSFPSLTFPNHYTIVTGEYPSQHGLTSNRFYDRVRKQRYSMSNKENVHDGSWYGGVPLWVLAEQQHMLSASFYWVGAEADIKGVRPTYYYNYSEKIPIEKRVEVFKEWLTLPAEKRPHLICFYFPEVDHAGHDFGPDSKENENAVLLVDSAIAKLQAAAASTGLNVNFVLVADHGMLKVNKANPLQLPAGVDTSKFIISTDQLPLALYAKDQKDILPTYRLLKQHEKNFTAYLKKDIPKRWHYNKKSDKLNRIGDIVIVSDPPYVFNIFNRRISTGWHGFDPTRVKEMGAIFYAWGPAFKQGLSFPTFDNIHVYPMVANLLGLNYNHTINGKARVLKKILKD
ncbi:MAG: alkaline phosphatase family protein [Segetibacter sp.]|nr:alkaline phosphatase family protein [Segetibacter sp.]